MSKVSVIMPCFNHGEFLMDSVNSILRQTHEDLELIVVDDCSTDNSSTVMTECAAQDRRVKPIRHEQNLGISRSRNDALQAADGEFVAFCDSDDTWEPEKLRMQLNLLRNNPGYDLTYSETLIIDGRGLPTGQRFTDLFPLPRIASGMLFQELIRRNFINIQSVLLRRECMREAGPFDEQIRWVEDWLYWIRLSRRHRFLYYSEPLARYRVHNRSTNLVQRSDYCVNRFKVFRRILRDYADLPKSAKSEITYRMGIDLCALGKRDAGRRLLWYVVAASTTDMRSLGSSCRALRRLIMVGNPAPKYPIPRRMSASAPKADASAECKKTRQTM
jgi:glycosyltransferase involved in cell wall biosynthesis